MKNTLTLIIAKICLKILKLFGHGSSLPGKVALKLDKNLLRKFNIKGKIIAVTGSSGKGSTSSMIVDTLRNLNYTVAHNMKGSNLKFGIATLLIENSNLKGVLKQDYVVFEIDERYTKYVFCDIVPDYLVVTNITRDQPPRQGNVDIVLNDIKKSIKKDTSIILNADSPYMEKLVHGLNNKVYYYSVNNNVFSQKESKYKKLNIYYCPICGTKLEYEYYNFEENGKYTCPKCNFKNNESICTVTSINSNTNSIVINDRYIINTNTKLLFNIYNVAAYFATLSVLNLDLVKCAKTMNNSVNSKIYSTLKYNGRKVFILNNKNENATTFNQSLNFLDNYKDTKTIIIGWGQISRRYEFNDISWLYDIDFELLNNYSIDKILCVGSERYDIATRLKLANIDTEKVVTFETIKDAFAHLNETNGNIYAILNFDYVEKFKTLIEKGAKK